MRHLVLTLAAATLAIPAAVVLPASPADARRAHVYNGPSQRHYRGCRHSSGTTGLVAGGVGGAVLGNAVGGGVLGTVAGGVAGAFGGRAIDRTITAKKRCR